MTQSKAILIGSVIIAAAILTGTMVFQNNLVSRLADGAQNRVEPSANTPSSRYQIVKADGGMSWRLDTETGEMMVCRLDGQRLFCALSSQATHPLNLSPEEAEKKQATRRRERRQEQTALFDRFFSFFERILRFAERDENKTSTPDDGDNFKRL